MSMGRLASYISNALDSTILSSGMSSTEEVTAVDVGVDFS